MVSANRECSKETVSFTSISFRVYTRSRRTKIVDLNLTEVSEEFLKNMFTGLKCIS